MCPECLRLGHAAGEPVHLAEILEGVGMVVDIVGTGRDLDRFPAEAERFVVLAA